jgi:hypothetical protein
MLSPMVSSMASPTGGIVGNDDNAMYLVGHYNKRNFTVFVQNHFVVRVYIIDLIVRDVPVW